MTLPPSASGDLLTTDDPTNRILRRLLTNPGDYLWHPDYGAGLPSRIGTVVNEAELTALIPRADVPRTRRVAFTRA